MWPSLGINPFVGSNSTQPMPGTNTLTQACEASAPVRRSSRRRRSDQITADVTRRKSQRAQAADLQMREILADALVRSKNFLNRRIDFRRAREKFEIVMDAFGQIENAVQIRATWYKGIAGESGQFRGPGHVRRFEDEFAGGQHFAVGRDGQNLQDLLPGRPLAHVARPGGKDFALRFARRCAGPCAVPAG
jgi:hypothetical protein